MGCSYSDLRRQAISRHWFHNPWSKVYFKRKSQVKASKTTFLVKVIKKKQYSLSGRIGNIRGHIRIDRCIGGNTYYVLHFICLLGQGEEQKPLAIAVPNSVSLRNKVMQPLVHLKHTHTLIPIFWLHSYAYNQHKSQ